MSYLLLAFRFQLFPSFPHPSSTLSGLRPATWGSSSILTQ